MRLSLRIEADVPAPLVAVDRDAWPECVLAHLDVVVVDVPAVRAF